MPCRRVQRPSPSTLLPKPSDPPKLNQLSSDHDNGPFQGHQIGKIGNSSKFCSTKKVNVTYLTPEIYKTDNLSATSEIFKTENLSAVSFTRIRTPSISLSPKASPNGPHSRGDVKNLCKLKYAYNLTFWTRLVTFRSSRIQL